MTADDQTYGPPLGGRVRTIYGQAGTVRAVSLRTDTAAILFDNGRTKEYPYGELRWTS